MKAPDILAAGLQVLEQRGRDRDQPGGERSIPSVVAAFNALTGHALTEQQGWIFMALVKIRRSQSGSPDADHYIDGSNYFALAGEAALRTAQARTIDLATLLQHRAKLLELAHQYARECGDCAGHRIVPDGNGGDEVCTSCGDVWQVIDHVIEQAIDNAKARA